MANNRCPMCGKPNPDDRDVCQFCEARLTPLIISDSTEIYHDSADERDDLRERSGKEEGDDPESVENPEDGDESDALEWLRRIRSDSEFAEGTDPPEDTEAETDETGSFSEGEDWLQRIRSLHEVSKEPEPLDIRDQFGVETIMRFDADIEGDEDQDELEDEDSPNWLDRLDETSDIDDIDHKSESEDEFPEWLNLDVHLTDDISERTSGGTETTPENHSTDESIEDWLSRMGIDSSPEEEQSLNHRASEIAPNDAGEDDTLPGWLSGSKDAQGLESTEAFKEPESIVSSRETHEALPDWLSGLHSEHELEDDQDDKPGEERLLETDEDGKLETFQTQGSDGEIPEWLSTFDQIEPEEGSEEAEDRKTADSDEVEDLDDWFSDPELEDTSAREGVSSDFSETDGELPDWLERLGSVITGTIEDEVTADIPDNAVAPFVSEEGFEDDLLDVEGLPDWLTPETAAEDRTPQNESELALADLPGWLAAIRPVEDGTLGVSEDASTIESAGPLAGLRGVLPAEPEIIHFQKPDIYSAKFRITNTQQTQVEIIRELLASEGKPEPIPEQPRISTQRVLRWAISVFLVIGLSLVLLSESKGIPLPSVQSIPDDTLAASRIISTIPSQAPALIAFDYDPGTSGEMHAAAVAIIDHMMLRGNRLALVSTLPTGPGIGEHFINDIQADHGYINGEQYTNLGYISGGTSGLLSFAHTPKLVTQQSYDGLNPWDSEMLQDVERLSDFSVFLVVTDDNDVARAWIEQVQPLNKDTPMLMVVSAQIEPLIRPYYGEGSSRQVAGMISGINGGAAYEVVVGKENLSRDYWDAFNYGLIVFIAVTIIGGGINIIQHYLTHGRTLDKEVVG